ncbi:hypothetical protein PTKIN_Ptkin14bG0188700 [Pterospermum kingtungense]
MGLWVNTSPLISSSFFLVLALFFPHGNGAIHGCDLFTGRWVLDPISYPLYNASGCPFIEREFTCQKNGRQDLVYTQYRWQPLDCTMTRFVELLTI